MTVGVTKRYGHVCESAAEFNFSPRDQDAVLIRDFGCCRHSGTRGRPCGILLGRKAIAEVKILITTDSLQHVGEAVALLLRMGFPSTSEVTLLGFTLRHESSVIARDDLASAEGGASFDLTESNLAQEAASLEEMGWSVHAEIASGGAVNEITRLAEQLGISLVVLTSHQLGGAKGVRIGLKIVTHTECSLLCHRQTC